MATKSRLLYVGWQKIKDRGVAIQVLSCINTNQVLCSGYLLSLIHTDMTHFLIANSINLPTASSYSTTLIITIPGKFSWQEKVF